MYQKIFIQLVVIYVSYIINQPTQTLPDPKSLWKKLIAEKTKVTLSNLNNYTIHSSPAGLDPVKLIFTVFKLHLKIIKSIIQFVAKKLKVGYKS